MPEPRIRITGTDPQARKKQLADQVLGDIQSIEEFFNQCHDKSGRFCPTAGERSSGGSSRVNSGGLRGKLASKKGRDDLKKDAQRFAELFVGLPGQSSLRANNFAKRSLRRYSPRELNQFKEQFQADARNLKTARKAAFIGIATIPINTNRIPIAAISATRSSIVIGFATWRMKKIEEQVTRIDNHLDGRKAKLSNFGVEEFANSGKIDPSLVEEIRIAQKQIDNGQIEKVDPLTKEELSEALKFINSLKVDHEEGISEPIIKALKEIVKAVESESIESESIYSPKIISKMKLTGTDPQARKNQLSDQVNLMNYSKKNSE